MAELEPARGRGGEASIGLGVGLAWAAGRAMLRRAKIQEAPTASEPSSPSTASGTGGGGERESN